MNRLISFLFVICLSRIVAGAAVGGIFKSGNFKFEIISDDETPAVAVNKTLVWSGKVEIPATVAYHNISYAVVKIGHNAFSRARAEDNQITEVVLPETIIEIGWNAFTHAERLQSINFPNGLQSIAENAFSNCISLESIYFPSSLLSIGERAFYKCSSLQCVILPESPVAVQTEAFLECSDVEILVIPAEISYMSTGCFDDCVSLKYVFALPESSDFANDGKVYTFNNIFDRAFLYFSEGSHGYQSSWEGFEYYFYINNPLIIFSRSDYEMESGENYQIEYFTTGYGNFPVTSMLWESDRPDIATVDENGLVTAIGSGIATITGTVSTENRVEGWSKFIVEVRNNSSLADLSVDKANMEYFTLQGLPAGGERSALAPGIYIRRQGKDVTKIIVK